MLSVLELYEKLKPKLGEDEARSLLEYVESTVEQRSATKADLHEAAASLRQEIERVKVDLIKWSFTFWLGTIAVLSGIMFTLLRTLPPR
jgi:hypothetical protein